jgi:hypothetical protein
MKRSPARNWIALHRIGMLCFQAQVAPRPHPNSPSAEANACRPPPTQQTHWRYSSAASLQHQQRTGARAPAINGRRKMPAASGANRELGGGSLFWLWRASWQILRPRRRRGTRVRAGLAGPPIRTAGGRREGSVIGVEMNVQRSHFDRVDEAGASTLTEFARKLLYF